MATRFNPPRKQNCSEPARLHKDCDTMLTDILHTRSSDNTFPRASLEKKTKCAANSSCTRPEGHALPRHARYHGQTLIDLQRQSLRTFGFSDCQDFVERPFSVERARSHPTLPASSQKPAASSHQPLVSSQQPLQLPISSQRPTSQ